MPKATEPHVYEATDPYKGCALCGYGPGTMLHQTGHRNYFKEPARFVLRRVVVTIKVRDNWDKTQRPYVVGPTEDVELRNGLHINMFTYDEEIQRVEVFDIPEAKRGR